MLKLIKNSSGNFLIICLIFSLIVGWFFSGWPRFSTSPSIPPEVQEARAADTLDFIVDTASTTWTVPNNWNYASNSVEVIGGGGGGGSRATKAGGGGGGAYAKKNNITTLTLGSTINVQVGTGGTAGVSGTATWFNDTTATTSDCGDQSVCASAGALGPVTGPGGAGGASSTSIGDTVAGGGPGGAGTQKGGNGGGGGAGRVNGTTDGKTGGAGDSTIGGDDAGGGGGGAGGALSTNGSAGTTTFGAGGAGPSGSGGGATAGANGSVGGGGAGGAHSGSAGNGGDGTEWTTAGAGGGGGGAGNGGAVGGNGGKYGGGGGGGTTGGTGGNGIIVITYTPAVAPGNPTDLATTSVTGSQVDLSWASSTDGGSYITYYNIYRGIASPATTLIASTTNLNATTSDTTVVGGTKYFYRVTAVNAVGEGGYSNEIYATPPAGTVSCDASVSATSFGSLSELSISTASPNASTTMSCTFAGGCTLWVEDEGDGANPGLATTSPAYLIPSNTATLSIGVEGYGIQAATTTSGSGGGLFINSTYYKSGNDVGGLSRTLIKLASSSASITGREVLITHKAAISATTPPGSYEDTIFYNCLGN